MTNSKPEKDYQYWVDVFNQANGYAGVFAHRDADDKALMELSTAEEWHRAMLEKFDVQMGAPVLNPNDPPDCLVEFEGGSVSVELVQLISAEHIKRASKGESQHAGKLFEDTQWSRDRFKSAVEFLICQKGNKYQRKDFAVDVLLIHTAEPWLMPGDVSDWLEQITVLPHSNIANVFLLVSYAPGSVSETWPLFRDYGELGGEDRSSIGLA
jgi:hypothetical protein